MASPAHEPSRPNAGMSAADRAFLSEQGYVVLPGVLDRAELDRLRAETAELLDRYATHPTGEDPDILFGVGHRSGSPVLRRVEHLVAKSPACLALLAHPHLLASIERIVGPDLLPTWDSMVVKMPGEGIAVPWHRDAGTDQVGDHQICNVDIYLDDTDDQTALWVVPGSHRWSDHDAWTEAFRREGLGPGRTATAARAFDTEGAVQVHLRAGDVLLHDILLVHGSPPSDGGGLRRVIYYEFRSCRVEAEIGPHTAEYLPRKQAVLRAALAARRQAGWIRSDEVPFDYRPPAPWEDEEPTDPTAVELRVPHELFWRAG